MKKIFLIYTGGTIGMMEHVVTGALESVNFDEALPNLHELIPLGIDINTYAFNPPVDSCDMDPSRWIELVKIIAENYEKYDGFVVLHGTDTMAYTASALTVMLEGLNKPVVLTGSQLPIGMRRTDGRNNLITALEIAAAVDEEGHPRVPEVTIFFHDKLLRGCCTTKSNADDFDAFRSFNYPPLADAAVDIVYHPEWIRPYDATAVLKPHYDVDCNMLVLSLFPGIQEQTVRSMLSISGLRGVVLRTFGAGNAPSVEWLPRLLKEYVDKGLTIVDVTQCAGGNVALSRYATGLNLQEAGVISGGDSTVEAALTKMMVL